MLCVKGVTAIEKDTDYFASEQRAPLPVYAVSFEYLGGHNVMPIGGWWGPYKAKNPICDLSDKKFYADLKDCGINHITVSRDDFATNPEAALQGMSYAEEYGLGMFMHDSILPKLGAKEEIEDRISFYKNRRNCIGFHVFDEPDPGKYEWIEKFYAAFEQLNIDKQYLYTNLLPTYGKTIFDKFNVDYEEYVDLFLSKVPTKFLSYDYYPFYFKGEGIGGAKKYFENLSIVRRLAKKHKVPFWVFLQAGGQWQCIKKPSIDKYPSREEMLWNLHTNLAYGAKAIQYFTLIQPEDFAKTDTGIDCRRIGLIGFDGEKNEWYNIAQEINRYISSVDEYLMNMENVGVIATGNHSNEWVLQDEKLTTFRELLSVEGTESIVGCFDYKGRTALYIVNNSTTEGGNVRLSFDCVRGFDVFMDTRQFSCCGKEMTLELDSGAGVLIILK